MKTSILAFLFSITGYISYSQDMTEAYIDSLAYDIVTKGHRGTLEVVCTEGVGSEFIIILTSYK